MSGPSFSFPKTRRLRLKREFSEFYKNARRLDHKCVRVWYSPKQSFSSKVAVSAGKYMSRSVDRIRCKRWLREIYRLGSHQFSDRYDYVLVCKNSALDLGYFDVQKAVYETVLKIQ